MIRLKDLREEKNILQKDMATALNRTRACISAWEQGKTEPSIDDLVKIADLLECSVDYLVGRDCDEELHPQQKKPQDPEKTMAELFHNLPERQKFQALGFVQALLKDDVFNS